MFVRTASERDIAAIRTLLAETWHATYDAIHGAERIDRTIELWCSPAKLKARIERPDAEFLVADDGKRIGGVAYAEGTDQGLRSIWSSFMSRRICRAGGSAACCLTK